MGESTKAMIGWLGVATVGVSLIVFVISLF